MDRIWLVVAAVNGFIAVGAGAFGAHGLKSKVGPEALAVFETGARYHMYHALALLAVGLVVERWRSGAASAAGWCFTAGIVVFCGSLYALALSNLRLRWLGAVTPLGGFAFLLGWALLALAAFRLSKN